MLPEIEATLELLVAHVVEPDTLELDRFVAVGAVKETAEAPEVTLLLLNALS